MKYGILLAFITLTTAGDVPYSFEATGVTTENVFSVSINIQPNEGWKWNTEYPAKFRIKFNEEVFSEYHKLDDNHLKGNFPWGDNPKTKSVTAIASFSLCTPIVCRVFRNQELTVRFKEELIRNSLDK